MLLYCKTKVACAVGPNVNRTLIIEPNCEETILHFKLIFNDKIYSKLNISPFLGLKIYKSHSYKASNNCKDLP
jgi:hypothetical protein